MGGDKENSEGNKEIWGKGGLIKFAFFFLELSLKTFDFLLFSFQVPLGLVGVP